MVLERSLEKVEQDTLPYQNIMPYARTEVGGDLLFQKRPVVVIDDDVFLGTIPITGHQYDVLCDRRALEIETQPQLCIPTY